IEEKQALADRIWQLPRVISARDGRNFIIDENGHYWRALSLITGASSHERVLSADHAHEAGCVLGHFQSLIADFPIAQLEDTLPGFHITPGYLQLYDRTVAKVEARRKLDASGEARRIDHFIQDRRDFAHVLERARERGELVLRPIHGDPKISNIMIDDHTGQGIAIIDLDTVKPGLIHYDFGDCVRSVCNPAGEEVRDLDAVDIDIDYFKALVSGYLKSTRELLSDADRHYLYDAVRLIAFELGLRFFTDYLLGDVYFKTTYPEQNLNRARVQLRLCESIETSERMMRNVLEEI
ncbi:MAG TPA: aminoglycoside phosphotransferase family protein, partial [Oceanipulchritudo sp.]|nr:aminoglycoside phosphotransferase family protein [Oceanipulchritudo sp.]